jgi:hypothetical protein
MFFFSRAALNLPHPAHAKHVSSIVNKQRSRPKTYRTAQGSKLHKEQLHAATMLTKQKETRRERGRVLPFSLDRVQLLVFLGLFEGGGVRVQQLRGFPLQNVVVGDYLHGV